MRYNASMAGKSENIVLHHGDCLQVLKTIEDCCIDAIVADPPYGLSFMGKKWDYDVPSVEIWAECLRVLKPGGHLLAFAGTRTQHRMAVKIEDAGFEIRDMIAWVYGSGFPKSHNLQGDWQGWGTALKPALEPITIARKPLIGAVAENVLEHGTGALNIDGCKVGNQVLPEVTAGQAKIGTFKRGVMVTPRRTGRWPANLIHDDSEEVTEQFPVTNNNSAARFFYCAKASKRDRDEGLEHLNLKGPGRTCYDPQYHEDGGKLPPRTGNFHPTVKPTDLMRYLCRLVTPPGGTVMDPFMGSGSTGKAAILEGFRFVGIEREEEYVKIAQARINNCWEEKQPDMFENME